MTRHLQFTIAAIAAASLAMLAWWLAESGDIGMILNFIQISFGLVGLFMVVGFFRLVFDVHAIRKGCGR
jgi:hypothetical protein